MATTTNYGWETPDDTDLVKDGASAIRTLGSSIDTTTKALNPSTTLGDIEYRSSTANTNTRLAIGTSGQVLSVSGGVPAWTTLNSGAYTSLATGTLSGTATNITSISGSYVDLYLVIKGAYVNTGTKLAFRFNSTSSGVYTTKIGRADTTTWTTDYGQSSLWVTQSNISTGSNDNTTVLHIGNYAATSYKEIWGGYFNYHPTGADGAAIAFCNFGDNTAITSINIRTENGTSTFSGGTYTLYGVK
jgi:hypothetical protein